MGAGSGKTVAIVGHGPSLLERSLGEWIDGQRWVIRQKRCQETLRYPSVYGTKTFAVCGSWTIAHDLPKIPAHEYWTFLDSRHDSVPEEAIEQAKAGGYKVLPGACRRWNKAYRERRTPFELWEGTERKTTSDDLGHTHMSAGLHALVYACELLSPERIYLLGYDNVRKGDFTWSVTRGPDWKKYPDHRWDIEKQMVTVISNNYEVGVEFL